MHEEEYWDRLEYRVCQEIAGLKLADFRAYWCDGFIPLTYEFPDPSPRIVGRVWIGIGPRRQEEWEFTLLLGRQAESHEAIEWSALLPAQDVTRWLSIDPVGKRLVVEPTAAVKDASECLVRNAPTGPKS